MEDSDGTPRLVLQSISVVVVNDRPRVLADYFSYIKNTTSQIIFRGTLEGTFLGGGPRGEPLGGTFKERIRRDNLEEVKKR